VGPMKPGDKLNEQAIDALYGLEPVFEPSGPGLSQSVESVTIQCPYCGEQFETAVDLSAGSFSYVEDCQVCCQPIELTGEVDDSGALIGVTANRVGRGAEPKSSKKVPCLPRPSSNALSPRKLLLTKWTAVNPRSKEKHFLVVKLFDPEPPGSPVVAVEIEAVHSKRVRVLPWRELMDTSQWMRGWV